METGIHELTAGYALDALEPEERDAYEAHLPGCERCRDELASLLQATEALAIASTGPAPAPELRERVLASARAEPQTVVPLDARRRRLVPVLASAAAIAVVVALALGVWAVHLSNDLDSTRSALARQRSAAGVVADPRSREIGLDTGQGRLVVGADGQAVLVLDGLAAAPTGKTYEAWIIERGAAARPAGTFAGGTGVDVVGVEGVVGPGDVIAVTVENAGGTSRPTTAPIAASSPV